jgi:hypothetical protein
LIDLLSNWHGWTLVCSGIWKDAPYKDAADRLSSQIEFGFHPKGTDISFATFIIIVISFSHNFILE